MKTLAYIAPRFIAAGTLAFAAMGCAGILGSPSATRLDLLALAWGLALVWTLTVPDRP